MKKLFFLAGLTVFLLTACTPSANLPEETKADLQVTLPAAEKLSPADYSPFQVKVSNSAGLGAGIVQVSINASGERLSFEQYPLVAKGSSYTVSAAKDAFVRAACDKIGQTSNVTVTVNAQSVGSDKASADNSKSKTYQVECSDNPWKNVSGQDLIPEPSGEMDMNEDLAFAPVKLSMHMYTSPYQNQGQESTLDQFVESLRNRVDRTVTPVAIRVRASNSIYKEANTEKRRIRKNFGSNFLSCAQSLRLEEDGDNFISYVGHQGVNNLTPEQLDSYIENEFRRLRGDALESCAREGKMLPEIKHDVATMPKETSNGAPLRPSMYPTLHVAPSLIYYDNETMTLSSMKTGLPAGEVSNVVSIMATEIREVPLYLPSWSLDESGKPLHVGTGKLDVKSHTDNTTSFVLRRQNVTRNVSLDIGESRSLPAFGYDVSYTDSVPGRIALRNKGALRFDTAEYEGGCRSESKEVECASPPSYEYGNLTVRLSVDKVTDEAQTITNVTVSTSKTSEKCMTGSRNVAPGDVVELSCDVRLDLYEDRKPVLQVTTYPTRVGSSYSQKRFFVLRVSRDTDTSRT